MKNQVDFSRIIISYGLVIRGDISAIEKLKQLLTTFSDLSVIYQVADGGRLYVVRDEDYKKIYPGD
jgi:hypothetical protein